MACKKATAKMLSGARLGLAFLAMIQFSFFGPLAGSARADDNRTSTPIKHVIIIVGENRTFDHLFATYKPKPGESVNNLLSEKIITESGAPGLNYAQANQYSADVTGHTVYELSPTAGKALYPVLPAPLNGGPTSACAHNALCNLGDASSSEDGVSRHSIDYDQFLLTGGTGLTGKVPDTRINGVNNSAPYSSLLPGPFQL